MRELRGELTRAIDTITEIASAKGSRHVLLCAVDLGVGVECACSAAGHLSGGEIVDLVATALITFWQSTADVEVLSLDEFLLHVVRRALILPKPDESSTRVLDE